MKKMLLKLKRNITEETIREVMKKQNFAIKKIASNATKLQLWNLVETLNTNKVISYRALGTIVRKELYPSVFGKELEEDLYLDDDDYLTLSENEESFKVLDVNILKGNYAEISLESSILDLSNDISANEEIKKRYFSLPLTPNLTLYPQSSDKFSAILEKCKNGETVWCTLKMVNKSLKVFIKDENDKNFILGAITYKDYVKNLDSVVIDAFEDGEEFKGTFSPKIGKQGRKYFLINFEYSEKNILEKLPESIINVINNQLLSEDEAIFLFKKFLNYNFPLKMIDCVMEQWKDYGEKLNKKIPSVYDAIFIDVANECYVKRCAGHIMGYKNKYPRLRLVGHLSTGKDVLIRTLAALFHKPLDIVTIFSDTQKEDIFGAKTIAKEGVIEYQPEPLIKAMENGTWVEFDEINTCDSGVLESLHKILDSEKAVNVAGYGRVKAKEGFGFFASMNPSDGNYSGTQFMNPATQSRMKTIEIKKTKSIKEILTSKCPFAQEKDIDSCSYVYEKIKECVQQESLSEAFLGVRLYEDALDSACWMPIKQALIDVVAHADTNDSNDIETIEQLINATLED